ncbi:MAG: hypothetical protein H6765_08910 [Candidatus Peribacteria bacterium]|nr:MAG: hypothetical protein H6765_08910 [Candidatus Peribacteria bacterium]
MNTEIKQRLYDVYLPQRIAKSITSQAILPNSLEDHFFADPHNVALTETVIIPDSFFSLNCEMVLFDENKMLIASLGGKEISGILIESLPLYQSFESMFLVMRHYGKMQYPLQHNA